MSFRVGEEFHAELITELYSAVKHRGFELALSGVTRHRPDAEANYDLLAFRCDALILLGPAAGRMDLAELAHRTPTVVVARSVSVPGVEVVRTDDETGAGMATQYLIELGHTRITHVDGGRAPGAAERRRGYKLAMKAAGLADHTEIVHGGVNDIDGSHAAHRMLGEKLTPTAVTVFNDQAAIGFLATVRSAGYRVPEDLSITGYDNTKISRTDWAQLTTIGQQASALASSALDKAIHRISGGPPTEPLLTQATLIPRATTAAPRGDPRRTSTPDPN